MRYKRSNTAERGWTPASRTAPPGEGWTAVGPGGDSHHPRNETPPGETRRIEGTGPGLRSGMADDLGTSGSRGALGARDEYDETARPGDGLEARRRQRGRDAVK